MTIATTIMGLLKAQGTDNARDYVKTSLPANLDKLDAHHHTGGVDGALLTTLPSGIIVTGAAPYLTIHDTTVAQTTPDKSIRSQGGVFRILNSALSADILTLDDTGNLTARVFTSTGGTVSHVKLAETVLGSAAATLTFAAIPASFRSLLLICSLRGDRAAVLDGVTLRFNGDTGTNYDWQSVNANGATPGATSGASVASIYLGQMPAASGTANFFGMHEILIPNYANTTTFKPVRSHSMAIANHLSNGTWIEDDAGAWESTAAINQIVLAPLTGATNFVAGSVASLYGVS